VWYNTGMKTTFQTGDRLRSLTSAQRLTKGSFYVVLDVESQSTPFGVFCSYKMQALPQTGMPAQVAEPLWIGNAHLLMEAVR